MKLSSSKLHIFYFCFIAIAGLALSVFCDFRLREAPDAQSYISMAQFDFFTNIHRKYRFVLPMCAAGINWLVHIFLPATEVAQGDFTLRLSFYFINVTLTSIWCALIYQYCRRLGIGIAGAFIALVAVITSRYTMILAGTPHTDILFCLVVILALYGVQHKHTGFVILACILGPFTKESFLFIAPLLFFSHLPWWKTFGLLLLSGIAVFASRYYIDILTGTTAADSMSANTGLLKMMLLQFTRLKIPGYWLDLFATFGLWWLLPILQKIKLKSFGTTPVYLRQWHILFFLGSTLFITILNGEFGRMLYMAMPVYAVCIGIATDDLLKRWNLEVVLQDA